jgi:glycosyltransferase involved in cell wall biosynthesis
MLRHHLPLADEIVVNEGFSTDGTFEAVAAIDPKITVFRSAWGEQRTMEWYRDFKNAARRRCTGDWCLYLDCDEFIPEWQFEPLRRHLETTSEILVPLEEINFYGNYRVFHSNPEAIHWPSRKMAVHRNLPEIEFWGDATNVRHREIEFEWPPRPYEFCCHHFGFVRHPSRLREKWRAQNRIYTTRHFSVPLPSFVFDLLPHRWDDPHYASALKPYDGPVIAPVRHDPAEFIRDGGQMYAALTGQSRSEARRLLESGAGAQADGPYALPSRDAR